MIRSTLRPASALATMLTLLVVAAPGSLVASSQAKPPTGPVRHCPNLHYMDASFTHIRAHGHNLTCRAARTYLRAWRGTFNSDPAFFPLGRRCKGHVQRSFSSPATWSCSGYMANMGCGHDGYTSDYCRHLDERVTLRFDMFDDRF